MVVIPFDRGFSEQSAEEFVQDVLIDRLGARSGLGRRELPLRQGREGRPPSSCARTPEFETRVVPLVEVAGETVSSSHIRGLVAAGDVGGGRVPGRAVPVRGRGGRRRPARARARRCRRPTWCPTTRYVCPGHGVYAAWAHGYPAAVNVGVRPTFETRTRAAGGGAPDRLRRRPVRPAAADRVPRAHARREALRLGGRARGADAARRRARPEEIADRLLRFPAR